MILPTYLYSGARLAVAEEWAASHPDELSSDEAEFLRCGREAQEQREATELEAARRLAEEQKQRAELSEQREKEQKEAARKLSRRAWIAAGLGVTALIFGVRSEWYRLLADHRAQSAEERARIAEKKRDEVYKNYSEHLDAEPPEQRLKAREFFTREWLKSGNLTVTQLKALLKRLNYYHGALDDTFDLALADSIILFQKYNNLQPADGIAGEHTIAKLQEIARAIEGIRPGE